MGKPFNAQCPPIPKVVMISACTFNWIWVWVVCPKKNVTFQKKIHGGRTGWSGLVQLDTSQSELDGASASQELGWANISRAEQSELSWLASQAELR